MRTWYPIQYVTNSKLATNINRLAGGGGYESIRKWLHTSAEKPLPDFKWDIVIAFDNDQVIGKSYLSRGNHVLSTSMIIAVCVAEVNKNGELQKQEDLMLQKLGHLTELPDEVLHESPSFYQRVKEENFMHVLS